MPPRILIVEDEEEIRASIVDELDDAGYEVVQAENGEKGLDAMHREQPDLVLSDISMPGIDGIQMLKAFRKDAKGQNDIPFIFLTAYSDKERQIAARRHGADEFLNKPIEFDLLLAAIENQLKKKRSVEARHEHELVSLFKKMHSNAAEWTDSPHEKAPAASQPAQEMPTAQGKKSSEAVWLQSDSPRSRTEALGGRITMIGLNDVKAMLGPRWDALASKVMQIAENKIAMNLRPSDVYRKASENSFELCIQGSTQAEASATARRIKQDILNAIAEAEEDKAFDAFHTKPAALQKVQTEFYPVTPTAPGASHEDLMQVMAAKIERAAKDFSENWREMMAQIVQDGECYAVPLRNRSFSQAPIAILMLDSESRALESRLRNALEGDSEKLLELDMVRLGLGIQCILRNSAKMITMFALPVDASSLQPAKSRQKYLALINSMPKESRSKLALIIENGHERLHPSLLSDILRSLKPFGVTCWLRITDPVALVTAINRTLAPIMTMNYLDLVQNVKFSPEKLKSFRRTLTQKKMFFVVDGIETETQKENARYLSPDYYHFDDEFFIP